MTEAVKWSACEARMNDIAPGIVVMPLAVDEFNGPRGNFKKTCYYGPLRPQEESSNQSV